MSTIIVRDIAKDVSVVIRVEIEFFPSYGAVLRLPCAFSGETVTKLRMYGDRREVEREFLDKLLSAVKKKGQPKYARVDFLLDVMNKDYMSVESAVWNDWRVSRRNLWAVVRAFSHGDERVEYRDSATVLSTADRHLVQEGEFREALRDMYEDACKWGDARREADRARWEKEENEGRSE